jgi:hypothetical protein
MNLARQLPGQSLFRDTQRIVDGVCLLNAFGGGSSKSSQTSFDQRTAASEGSLAVGAGGKFLESDSLDISGSTGAELGTTHLNAGGDVNVTTSDPDVLKEALRVYDDLASKSTEANRDLSLSTTTAFSSYAKQLQDEKSNDLETVLASLGDLEQTTDEQAQQRKTFLYLVLGVLALLALLFAPWNKIK